MTRLTKLAGALLLALLLLAACSQDDAGDLAESADYEMGSVSGDAGAPPSAYDADVAGEQGERWADDGPAEDGQDTSSGERALPVDSRDPGGRHVIRQGWFTVVYETTFDDAFGEVAAIAERLDGGVSGVSSEMVDDGAIVGQVTVRVPAEAYDRLLLDVAGIGEVVGREVTEEDVSGQVVDLRSRLRHLERQETFYLGLFDDADGISDAITIQNNLDRVQQAREEVQGRLAHLEDRTSMSTLRVRLVPEGHEVHGLTPRTAGFAGYWEAAIDAFVRVTGTLLVFAVGGAPLLALLALAFAGAVLAARVWRVKGDPRPSETSARMSAE